MVYHLLYSLYIFIFRPCLAGIFKPEPSHDNFSSRLIWYVALFWSSVSRVRPVGNKADPPILYKEPVSPFFPPFLRTQAFMLFGKRFLVPLVIAPQALLTYPPKVQRRNPISPIRRPTPFYRRPVNFSAPRRDFGLFFRCSTGLSQKCSFHIRPLSFSDSLLSTGELFPSLQLPTTLKRNRMMPQGSLPFVVGGALVRLVGHLTRYFQ